MNSKYNRVKSIIDSKFSKHVSKLYYQYLSDDHYEFWKLINRIHQFRRILHDSNQI